MTKPSPRSPGASARLAGGDVTRLEGPESANWWASYVAKQQVARRRARFWFAAARAPKETAVLAASMTAALRELALPCHTLPPRLD